jgi:hypothetical protein
MKTGLCLLLVSLLPFPTSAHEEPPQRFPLVTSAEITAIEARVNARVEANEAARCPRPVLRGTPKQGSGEAAMAEIVEGGAAVEGCYSFYQEHAVEFSADFSAFVETEDGISQELLEELETTCGHIPALISAAVAHEELCSPWRPGRRGAPLFLNAMRTARLTALLGRFAYRTDDGMALVRAALDQLRFDQDMVRGGGGLVPAFIATANMGFHVPWLRWLLDRSEFSKTDLDEVMDSFRLLLETEPRIGGAIQASGLTSILQEALPLVKGEDWVPPGGWDDVHVPLRDRKLWTELEPWDRMAKQTISALVLVILYEHYKAEAAACPVDSGILECMHGLERFAGEARRRSEAGFLARIVRILASPRVEMRSGMGVFSTLQATDYRHIIITYAWRLLLLSQLRIHTGVLREWKATGSCPNLQSPHLQELFTDPVFGGWLEVQRNPDTEDWLIRPSGEISYPYKWGEPDYRFSCPPTSAGPGE